ncbi:unnamed protein product [Callosobruchus maculatus]|uniref:Uncharacterized protein n=1 Tax=Callosobruchus maculatus TaxID=64391 RepID=A0A653CVS0_CALMS|nr:unnamed protein product [Callosobruchus maculatus]
MYILTIYQYRSNFCIHSLNLDFEFYATTLDLSNLNFSVYCFFKIYYYSCWF